MHAQRLACEICTVLAAQTQKSTLMHPPTKTTFYGRFALSLWPVYGLNVFLTEFTVPRVVRVGSNSDVTEELEQAKNLPCVKPPRRRYTEALAGTFDFNFYVFYFNTRMNFKGHVRMSNFSLSLPRSDIHRQTDRQTDTHTHTHTHTHLSLIHI